MQVDDVWASLARANATWKFQQVPLNVTYGADASSDGAGAHLGDVRKTHEDALQIVEGLDKKIADTYAAFEKASQDYTNTDSTLKEKVRARKAAIKASLLKSALQRTKEVANKHASDARKALDAALHAERQKSIAKETKEDVNKSKVVESASNAVKVAAKAVETATKSKDEVTKEIAIVNSYNDVTIESVSIAQSIQDAEEEHLQLLALAEAAEQSAQKKGATDNDRVHAQKQKADADRASLHLKVLKNMSEEEGKMMKEEENAAKKMQTFFRKKKSKKEKMEQIEFIRNQIQRIPVDSFSPLQVKFMAEYKEQKLTIPFEDENFYTVLLFDNDLSYFPEDETDGFKESIAQGEFANDHIRDLANYIKFYNFSKEYRLSVDDLKSFDKNRNIEDLSLYELLLKKALEISNGENGLDTENRMKVMRIEKQRVEDVCIDHFIKMMEVFRGNDQLGNKFKKLKQEQKKHILRGSSTFKEMEDFLKEFRLAVDETLEIFKKQVVEMARLKAKGGKDKGDSGGCPDVKKNFELKKQFVTFSKDDEMKIFSDIQEDVIFMVEESGRKSYYQRIAGTDSARLLHPNFEVKVTQKGDGFKVSDP